MEQFWQQGSKVKLCEKLVDDLIGVGGVLIRQIGCGQVEQGEFTWI
jgi:hypothetical protein